MDSAFTESCWSESPRSHLTGSQRPSLATQWPHAHTSGEHLGVTSSVSVSHRFQQRKAQLNKEIEGKP